MTIFGLTATVNNEILVPFSVFLSFRYMISSMISCLTFSLTSSGRYFITEWNLPPDLKRFNKSSGKGGFFGISFGSIEISANPALERRS
jgi:hypothetical protein